MDIDDLDTKSGADLDIEKYDIFRTLHPGMTFYYDIRTGIPAEPLTETYLSVAQDSSI